ncbi:X-Pro dipeptidyl-peptidase [Streptomyces sp. AS58]|uniref:CocE/NonD family hydrolase n=1 Tax=Streptomyces sp. AS58 TaxID=1519489 RepID=UPI0006AFB955|nr:CocE/NonD family hydrolase [Streptomyces sp. AS58]KOV74850.1 X-Pro dipeptidyl-peptidase [Streptomyces sp. AS58]
MKTPPLTSLLVERLRGLPAPKTRDLAVERDLEVPMRDGTVLLADRWAPRAGGEDLPTALLRSPYGRGGPFALQLVRPLAERGFQVLLQSTRGTSGSGGAFDPLRHERLDGIDTVDWVCKQPWFDGSLVLCGPSYLGYTQWAMADQLPAQVKAMIPAMTESALGLAFLRKDAFALESAFGWGVLVEAQRRRWATARFLLGARRRRRAEKVLPLCDADNSLLGRQSDIIQNFIVYDTDSPFWYGTDASERVPHVTVPASLIAGWHDVFLPGQLRDYALLQAAGRRPRLTIGPWSHNSASVVKPILDEILGFGLAHARGTVPDDRAPVRVFVMGAEQWRDLPAWPPPGYAPEKLHLHPAGRLALDPPSESAPDSYRYDPADPTPAVGGLRLLPGVKAGRVDNTAHEARHDVLTYTSDILTDDVEMIGEVGADIWFRSSLPHADVFVRVCDVDASGRSTNICDGIRGVTGADELSRVAVTLSPTAYLFRRGHRIRLQISSGAFPQYNRNPGTGEPRRTATRLEAATQQVFHDPDHPSTVSLPTRAH